jgi:hypothetical protein
MKCEDADRLMIDYLDGNLAAELHAELEGHLVNCERCLDELRDIQDIFRVISTSEPVEPDKMLRINFYHMLHREIGKAHQLKPEKLKPSRQNWFSKQTLSVAAGIAILIAGTFLGFLLSSGLITTKTGKEISQLQSEVSDLKKATMMSMLKGESTSDRIEAVRYADDLDKPDQNVIDVLVRTLNNDRNVNVRMAAAYALSKFSNQRSVCDSLVKALSIQSDPILQVTLINILAEKKEKSALVPIEKIIADKNTMKEVRDVAKNSLRVLAL